MEGITLSQLHQNREQLLAIFQKHHSSNVHVFGSVARGEATPNSDVDFLCEPDYKADLGFFPIDLKWELEAFLGKSVDVVTPTILNNKYLGPVIKAEMVAL
jgi:uncharacterized protein